MYVIKSKFKNTKTNKIQEIYFIKFKKEKVFGTNFKVRYCSENLNGARLFSDNELEEAKSICSELQDNFSIYPICPLCGHEYEDKPAISRTDNKTKICSKCGFNQAIACFYKR